MSPPPEDWFHESETTDDPSAATTPVGGLGSPVVPELKFATKGPLFDEGFPGASQEVSAKLTRMAEIAGSNFWEILILELFILLTKVHHLKDKNVCLEGYLKMKRIIADNQLFIPAHFDFKSGGVLILK